jgi:hypothetical protein
VNLGKGSEDSTDDWDMCVEHPYFHPTHKLPSREAPPKRRGSCAFGRRPPQRGRRVKRTASAIVCKPNPATRAMSSPPRTPTKLTGDDYEGEEGGTREAPPGVIVKAEPSNAAGPLAHGWRPVPVATSLEEKMAVYHDCNLPAPFKLLDMVCAHRQTRPAMRRAWGADVHIHILMHTHAGGH